jgi:hypothetical protein
MTNFAKLLLLTIICFAKAKALTPPWSFIAIADWHGVESFALDDISEDYYLQRKDKLQTIKAPFKETLWPWLETWSKVNGTDNSG